MADKLHYLPISHHCVKARRILEAKRIPFEIVPGPYHDRARLLEVSGQDYVPYLEFERPQNGKNGVTWSELADWAEAKAPNPTLYPDGSRAVARIVEQWAHNELEEAVWKWVLPDAPKAFADPKERWVFVEMQIRKRGDDSTWATYRPQHLENLKSHIRLVEEALEKNPWILGSKPSLADFAVYGALAAIEVTGNALPGEMKRTRDWHARVKAL